MPRFEPFAGLRYDVNLPVDRLIAPPYDVVGPEQREELAARHRANAIHVELPAEDRALGLDRYANAGRLLEAWQGDGLLVRDLRPAFYGYRMTAPGAAPTTGVIGALDCEGDDGDVLPHEQTIAKDTTDRLSLLRAAHANLSPIWGLSMTEGLSKLLEPTGDTTTITATDDDGVRHELWVIDDPEGVEAVRAAVGASPVVIADGHHRYHVAKEYQQDQRQAHNGRAGEYDAVMALVVELSEEQLRVGPIHRALRNTGGEEALRQAFERWFDMVHAGPTDEQMLSAIADSGAFALVTPEAIWLLTPRPEALEAAGSDLDSSLTALALAGIPGAESQHYHTWREATDVVTGGDAEAAVLLRAVTVAQIQDWAGDRQRMPPKSTYFYPKPRTGMVYRTVEA